MSGICREQQIHNINKQTVSFHHHLLQPLFDRHPPPPCMLTTTTTWCCHITSWMKHDGSWWRPGMSTDVPRHPDSDNACHCHCPHNFRWAATPSHFLTRKAGATLKTAMRQLTMDQQQQHVMYTNNGQGWGEHHNPPCPTPFSHQKQEPRRCWWHSNPQWTTKTNEQPQWQMNVTTTTNEGWRPGTSSRQWWRQASSLSTLIQVSDSCPLTFVNMKAGPCRDVSTNNGWMMTNNNKQCYNV